MDVDIQNSIKQFQILLKQDENGRYKSYEHCRQCFLDNRTDEMKYDLITLHLYAYLASWGMLRNSFLMQKDYLFNLPVVRILCKEEYSRLLVFDPFADDCDDDISLIMKLRDEIRSYYLSQTYIKDSTHEKIRITNVTDTLVTKIILGTIGCVPAYDQYFVSAIRQYGICGTFNAKSMTGLIKFAKETHNSIENACKGLGSLYTPMKIIDMYFWENGVAK